MFCSINKYFWLTQNVKSDIEEVTQVWNFLWEMSAIYTIVDGRVRPVPGTCHSAPDTRYSTPATTQFAPGEDSLGPKQVLIRNVKNSSRLRIQYITY